MRVWFVLAHYHDGGPAEAFTVEAKDKAHAWAEAVSRYPRAVEYEVSETPDGRRNYD